VPDTGQVPLVADMSSHILSRPMDVSRYALIYAGAQKNIGPAGLTIVILREDMLGQVLPGTPGPLNYAVHAEAGSMSNTPPTWAVYIAGLVFQWLQQQGGIEAMARRNQQKAALLYDFIDASSLFSNPIRRQDRSLMNVPFWLKDAQLDAAFLQGAQARGLLQLKGHRIVGGMRASLYNAMSLEGVQALVGYMQEFETQHA
jgi:phosphoserine aminotransferase